MIAYSAGNALIGSARGDSVWLFGLGGTLPPAVAGAPVSRLAAPPPASRPVGVADLGAGRRVYEQACALCHGADGKGGHGAGAPLTGARDLAATIDVVTAGRNSMPPFGVSLSPEQIRDVSAYVVETLAAP